MGHGGWGQGPGSWFLGPPFSVTSAAAAMASSLNESHCVAINSTRVKLESFIGPTFQLGYLVLMWLIENRLRVTW